MSKNCILGLLLIVLFNSCCSVPDEDSPIWYFLIRFGVTKGIDRCVLYTTEQKKYEIPLYISLYSEILSQIPEFNFISYKKYYANYSIPFELYIHISLLDRTIKEIKFLRCELLTNKIKYNLFDIVNEDMKLSEYRNYYRGGFSTGPYRGDFNNGKKFVVNNNEKEYYDGFSLLFKKLPFDYNISENIKIIYDVIVLDEDNNMFEYNLETEFKRKFVEREDFEAEWTEISYDEWRKYL
jgi:hypothetical protein